MLLLKKISILFAVFVATTLANAQQGSLPVKYNKEILIEAKWGDGPGEFQLEPMNETQTWTTYLVLDKQDNIYIADPNNYRINIFNLNGKYIKDINLSEEDIKEQEAKRRVNDIGSIISGVGVNSKGHVFIGLSALGNDFTVIEFDINGRKVRKYFFPKVWVGGFDLLDDKNNIYLLGSWYLIDKSLYGYQCVYTAVPLSLGEINRDKNSTEVVDAIKKITMPAGSLPQDKKFNNGYSGYYSGSGDVVIKDSEGSIIYNMHHSLLIENHRVAYKLGQSASVEASIVFDNEGNFYVIQCKQEGLELLKYKLMPGDIK